MKTSIKAVMKNGTTIDIADCEIFGDLALHRTIASDTHFGKWTITHVRSGGCVWRHDSVRKARSAVKALAMLDWSRLKTGKEKEVLAEIAPFRAAILLAIDNGYANHTK